MAQTNTKTLRFFRDRILLFLLLCIFIILKLQHLHAPFYWDECWPYASAVRRMYEAGPTLLPGIMDTQYSRGHPLLFLFLGSSWMKLFGTSFVAMHSFPLTVASLGVVALYEAGMYFFNRRIAFIAALLLAFQVIYFVQSSFVLPEVLLAVLCFVSYCFYAARKWLAAGITISLLLFVKESGVVAAAVLGMHALLQLRNKDLSPKQRLAGLLATGVPFVLLAAFFIAQYRIEGWLIFPVHEHLIDRDLSAILGKLRNCFDILFTHDLRVYYLLLLIVVMVIAAIVKRSGKRLSWTGEDLLRPAAGYRLLRLFLWLLPMFFIFSAINMLIARYLIITLLPFALLLAFLLDRYAKIIHSYAIYIVIVGVIAIEAIAFHKDKGINDRNLGAYDGMAVQQHLAQYLERRQLYDIPIATKAYLERVHITDPYAGFLSSKRTFTQVSPTVDGQSQILMFTNIEPDETYERYKSDPAFQLVYRYVQGEAWGEVYQRK